MEDLRVPILTEKQGKKANVTVWDSKMLAVDQGDAAAEWINKYLEAARGERKLRFFRVDESFKRVTDPKYAPDYETGTMLCATSIRVDTMLMLEDGGVLAQASPTASRTWWRCSRRWLS